MTAPPTSDDCLAGGGAAGAALRATDWSAHPLGPPSAWPPALRTAIASLLQSAEPMVLVWGAGAHRFCNDAGASADDAQTSAEWTGRLAHDFNNLLGAIGGSLQVLQTRLDKGRTDGLERYLAIGQDGVRQAAALAQRVLALSRRERSTPRMVDPNELLRGLDGRIRRIVGADLAVEVVADDAAWPVRIDPAQLEGALLDLCANARDAMPAEGGRLTLTLANRPLDAAAAAALGLAPGDHVVLSVADTGAGMDDERLARAFEPFFTTRTAARGAGLGLPMARRLVRRAGGELVIASAPGQGTTASVWLPRRRGGTGSPGA